MVINRYLRCLFGHKKVIVDILRSSFIGSLNFGGHYFAALVGAQVTIIHLGLNTALDLKYMYMYSFDL